MSQTLIRPAHPADLPALVELEGNLFTADRLSRRSLAQLARQPSAGLLVAEHAGQVIGYALVLFRRNSRVARLYSIARLRESGPTGVGSALLEGAEEAARERSARELRLEVRPDNASALRLYERNGYRVFGRRAHYYEDGADALRMRKSL